ncbi:hypothetical protein HRI_000613900 [Hibiscus trionum]|uniref:Pectinesterase inhibitor domain-containing protein n=1 Tax=Hibiscus trionum TaxID=183268 RepID=A0A9W7H3U7_HIBTR|nr:hypothetical protein HRI_000613900 [Hibiscus trionum]
MKPVTNNVASVLLFFVCLSLVNSTRVKDNNSNDDIIDETCAAVTYKNICLEGFHQENPTEDLKDGSERVVTAIKIASNNGTDIALHIEQSLDQSKNLKPEKKKAYEACEANFDTALKKLEDTLESMENEEYEKMKDDITSAIEDAKDCESGSHEDPVLSKKTKMFCKQCENAIDIITKFLH